MNVLSGCGLGGTSLINANVSLEPDPAILEDPCWPEALRTDCASLATGFRRAREMLQPEQYPSSYPRLNKVDALRQAGAGQSFRMVPVNVRFQGGSNAVGVEQEPCTCCGDCVSGCNVGAKNTLLMNYLPDAVRHRREDIYGNRCRSSRESIRWRVEGLRSEPRPRQVERRWPELTTDLR